jgi:hypothetical protein
VTNAYLYLWGSGLETAMALDHLTGPYPQSSLWHFSVAAVLLVLASNRIRRAQYPTSRASTIPRY